MLPNYLWPDVEQVAEKLAPIAEELVQRIREEPPTALCRELLGGLDGWELWGLACLLAAQVDHRAPYEVRVGWAKHDDVIRHARPIPVDPDEPTEAELTSGADPEVVRRDAKIRALARQRLGDEEIGEQVGLSPEVVGKRRRAMGVESGMRRGETRATRVERPAGVGVAG